MSSYADMYRVLILILIYVLNITGKVVKAGVIRTQSWMKGKFNVSCSQDSQVSYRCIQCNYSAVQLFHYSQNRYKVIIYSASYHQVVLLPYNLIKRPT